MAFNYYNKNLKEFASDNRKKMTKAEASLWKYLLSNGQLNGIKFRRQRPIYKYIVDFCSLELKFIIEVDGITHQNEEQYFYDINRQKDLENLGFKVIRFKDSDILRNIDGVRIVLIRIINELRDKPPSPSGLPKGEDN